MLGLTWTVRGLIQKVVILGVKLVVEAMQITICT